MSSASWSIDELARLVGVPSRTIREYKTVGLLPAPERVGRVGMYGEEHRRRLELIARLQTRGYSLAGIRDVLDAWNHGRSLDELIGASALDEAPLGLSTAQLVERLPPLADGGAIRAAARAGLIVPDGDGRWLVRSEALLTIVADLTEAGVAIGTALQAVRRLRDSTRRQGDALAGLFVDEVWSHQTAGDSIALARRARPLIAQAVASLVADALGNALIRHASTEGDGELAALVEQLRVGVVIEPDRPRDRGDRS